MRVLGLVIKAHCKGWRGEETFDLVVSEPPREGMVVSIPYSERHDEWEIVEVMGDVVTFEPYTRTQSGRRFRPAAY